MSAKRLGYAVGAVSLVASGTYLLVYLYRWEWNRALIAGVFFVATEIGLLGGVLLGRLRSIEQRLQRFDHPAIVPEPAPGVDERALAHLRDTAPPPSRPFAWLRPENERLGVFVPLLLGAGMVMSALAWVVERAARMTAKPAMERSLATQLGALSLPDGGFLAGPVPFTVSRPPDAARKALLGRARRLVFLVVAVALAVVALDKMADLTQDRPDTHVASQSTELVLAARHRNPDVRLSATSTAESYWAVCHRVLPGSMQLTQVTDLGGGRIRMVVAPGIGEHAMRKFTGCLNDATFNHLQAGVVQVQNR